MLSDAIFLFYSMQRGKKDYAKDFVMLVFPRPKRLSKISFQRKEAMNEF